MRVAESLNEGEGNALAGNKYISGEERANGLTQMLLKEGRGVLRGKHSSSKPVMFIDSPYYFSKEASLSGILSGKALKLTAFKTPKGWPNSSGSSCSVLAWTVTQDRSSRAPSASCTGMKTYQMMS
jgi:hypothetical protein